MTDETVTHIGVDGCPSGWLAVFERDAQLDFLVCDQLATLTAAFPQADVFVDIPIGLPWKGYETRGCDSLARKRLGSRKSSVFPVPCRAASRADTVEEARRLNIAELNSSLPVQAWGICKKIAEVDRLLLSDASVRNRVHEIHPELCFAGLNDGVPMSHSKRTEEGADERLALLNVFDRRSSALLERAMRKPRVARYERDDVLDALVGFVTAALPVSDLQRLSADPRVDQEGLPMEMVFARRTASRSTTQSALPALPDRS